MSTYLCPKGHTSIESDYCSECGAKIDHSSVDQPAKVVAASVQQCPDCATLHDAEIGNFCEICGYNFATGARGELPIVTPVEPLPDLDTPIADDSNRLWQAVITIDLTPHHPDSPAPPTDQAPTTIALDAASYLIGRTSQMRAIHPDIALDFDDAVSHRHAILQHVDETITLRDIGSSNGTKINGIEIAPMIDTAIDDGDEITLGHWTRIKIIAQPNHEWNQNYD